MQALDYLKENSQFLLICLSWVVVGMYGGPLIYPWLAATLILLKYKGYHAELLIGLLFMIVLDDNRLAALNAFTANAKALYIVMLAGFFFFDQKTFKPFNKFYLAFIPFFLLAFLVMLRSEILFTSFQKTLSYALLVFVVPNYITVAYRQLGDDLWKRYIYFGALMLFIGFLLIPVAPHIAFDERFRGILGNANGLGLYCSVFFPLAFAVNEQKPGLFPTGEKWFIGGMILLSVLFCGSRNALATILILVFFWRLFKVSPMVGFISFIVIIVSYQLLMSNFVDIVFALGLQEYFRVETLQTMSNRVFAWEFAWKEIQNNFWLGKGFAHDEYVFQEFETFKEMIERQREEPMGRVANVHNSFLGFWLNTGLVGLLLYLAAFLSKFVKAAKYSILAFPIMFAMLFSANFEAWLMASLNPFTMQLFIILVFLNSEFFQRETQVLTSNRE